MNFGCRTEKESKSILHFLVHKFEEAYTGAASGIVGDLTNMETSFIFKEFFEKTLEIKKFEGKIRKGKICQY